MNRSWHKIEEKKRLGSRSKSNSSNSGRIKRSRRSQKKKRRT